MKRRHLIVGAGRIGAGWEWDDLPYTHAGASVALKERIELVGFVEPNPERADAAEKKWGVTAYESLQEGLTSTRADIVSVCTQPEDQLRVLPVIDAFAFTRAIWCEKPYMGYPCKKPVQVNYMRRGDDHHRYLATVKHLLTRLVVYGKDDITTRCHFTDLAKWWGVPLDYRPYNGPCAYILEGSGTRFFDMGGVNGGDCFRNMLWNLLDHVDNGSPLWSKP